jgi:hypothetical protein
MISVQSRVLGFATELQLAAAASSFSIIFHQMA